jgi:uncharacterized MAPEG superfamily protein
MINLIVCVGMFYVLHLFLKMSFSLHKVPFIEWTYTGGNISKMTELSERVSLASTNLMQSLPVFFVFSVLSVIQNVDNLLLAQTWFVLRIVYLFGSVANIYKYKLIRPIIWLPSIVILICMGLNLYSYFG